MGNRAVVTTKSATGFCEDALGVYLHWNGGRDSITAFLKYCELQGLKSPEIDSKSWNQFQRIVMNYGLSCDIDKCKNLDCDNGDNGVYMIENWQIVGREFMRHAEQDVYPLKDMLLDIDEKQPAAMQIRGKILVEFSEAEKIVMDVTGSYENGFNVVQILITKTGRHYSTLYHHKEYGQCIDWMNAHAAKNGFRYDKDGSQLWIKTA